MASSHRCWHTTQETSKSQSQSNGHHHANAPIVFCQTCCSERININKFKKLKKEFANNDDDRRNSNGGMMRVCVFCSKLKTKEPLLGIGRAYTTNTKTRKYLKEHSSITLVYDAHIEYVISALCQFESLGLEWKEKIHGFCKRMSSEMGLMHCEHIHTFNDIRHYVKVKRISGGKISDCAMIQGVMFRKNVSHRKMRTDILRPKILLLDQAITYHRMNSKFHSFDISLKQNEEYMRMIVNKMLDLGPDIVVVSKHCDRLALKEMCKENITAVCNVESSTMERIARAIGAPIIRSIDHMNQLDAEQALGECGRFYVKYYNVDPFGDKGRRTPLMVFAQCKGGCHATILLRGANKAKLLRAKHVIRLAMHTNYHCNLEKSLLANLKACIGKRYQLPFYYKLQAENEQVAIVIYALSDFLQKTLLLLVSTDSMGSCRRHRTYRTMDGGGRTKRIR